MSAEPPGRAAPGASADPSAVGADAPSPQSGQSHFSTRSVKDAKDAKDAKGADPTDEADWMADGVRHQIMLRVLPVQRHDMLGPLSVLRMALAVLRRRLARAAESVQAVSPAAEGPDWPGLQAKAQSLEQQVADAVSAAASLRWWDGQHRASPISVEEIVAQCAALTQLAMSLRGQRLTLAPPPEASTAGRPPTRLPVPAGHHALLGLLLHATEAQPAVQAWRLHWDECALQLHPVSTELATGLPPEQSPLVEPLGAAHQPDPRLRPISVSALSLMLAQMGWQLARQADAWRLSWPSSAASD